MGRALDDLESWRVNDEVVQVGKWKMVVEKYGKYRSSRGGNKRGELKKLSGDE